MAPKAKKKAAAAPKAEPEKKAEEAPKEEVKEEPKKEEPKKEEPKKEEPKKVEPKVEAPVAKVVAAAKPEVKAEPEKRKAEEKAEEPAKKESKTTETSVKTETAKKEAAKKETKMEEDAEGGEVEKDAPADQRPTLKEQVVFNAADTTLNVIPTMGGKVLMSLTEGGMQYLIAAARANTGIKAGRYAYEVKIVEALNLSDSSAATRGRGPVPRQLVRLGFSTAGSPLILGDASEEHVFFDSEGAFCANKKKVAASQRFTREQVITVVLNLDQESPNANTLSLFREGERIAPPQAIPEELHGKTLYPHIAFRNVTVHLRMGPKPAKELPFQCRMIQAAAQEDVQVDLAPKPKDGKFDVMLPVAFPDEGTFDWLDGFLAKNPQYVEISDRKILEWAAASGVSKPKVPGLNRASNDKPEFNFGLPGMDDASIRRVLNTIVPIIPRNYVVMEVKSNLIEAERKDVLKMFSGPNFKTTAHVIMGEPSDDFRQLRLDKMLKHKQETADAAWKTAKAQKEHQKQFAQRQKQMADLKKKADEQRKKVALELQKKAAAAKKKVERDKKVKEAAAKGEEPPPEEEEEEEMEVDEVAEEPKDDAMEEDEETEPPQVELTEEEKKMWCKVQAASSSDLSEAILNQSFGNFSIPDKDEGFDDVTFEWQAAAGSREYLRTWVLEKKRTSRVEDLQPGQWFQDTQKEWAKSLSEWQAKHKTLASSALLKAKEAAAAAAAKKKAAEKKAAEGEEEPVEEEEEEGRPEEVDIMSVEDITDVGDGVPLFKDFVFEDWALLFLRVELYLLQIAFKKDVSDPDRCGIPEQHLAFYYHKYFKKQLNLKHFGVTTLLELTDLVKGTISWSDAQALSTPLPEDLETPDMLVKMTEENRRERQRRIGAGDETAQLKFSPLAIQQPPPAKAAGVAFPGGVGGAIRPGAAFPVRPLGGLGGPVAPKAFPGAIRPGGAIFPQGAAFPVRPLGGFIPR